MFAKRGFYCLCFMMLFTGIINYSVAGERPDKIYNRYLDDNKDMLPKSLMSKFYKKRAYKEKISYNPVKLPYYKKISAVFPLSKNAKLKLREQGFVMLNRACTKSIFIFFLINNIKKTNWHCIV